LRQLRFIEHHGWSSIITLDESQLNLSPGHEQIWLRVEEQPPEKTGNAIHDPKTMVAIAWNPLGCHVSGTLPKGNTFNTEYYRVNILTYLLPFRPQVDGETCYSC
jgi:hypothetical protein